MMADLDLSYTQLGIMAGVAAIMSGFLQIAWSLLNLFKAKKGGTMTLNRMCRLRLCSEAKLRPHYSLTPQS